MKQFKICAWKFDVSKGYTKRIDYPTEYVEAENRFEAYGKYCQSKLGKVHCTIVWGDGVQTYRGMWDVTPGVVHDTWKTILEPTILKKEKQNEVI